MQIKMIFSFLLIKLAKFKRPDNNQWWQDYGDPGTFTY